MEKVIIKDAQLKQFGLDEVTITIKPWQVKWLADYKGKALTIEVKETKSKRTIRQNSMLWALISEIDQTENGRTSEDGEMAIYCNLIRMARIKTLDYTVTEEVYQHTLKQGIFRHIGVTKNPDGTLEAICYLGTSHFDIKEMTDFIETTLDYAAQLKMNLSNYEDLRSK